MSLDYTSSEMMTVTAARALENGTTCFVGIGLPSEAANLARLERSLVKFGAADAMAPIRRGYEDASSP